MLTQKAPRYLALQGFDRISVHFKNILNLCFKIFHFTALHADPSRLQLQGHRVRKNSQNMSACVVITSELQRPQNQRTKHRQPHQKIHELIKFSPILFWL